MTRNAFLTPPIAAVFALIASCAHGRGQAAFGVAAEALRAYTNSSCAVVDVKISNTSNRLALLLTHPSYPYILAFTEAEDIRLSLHELPAHRILDPHNPPPQGVQIPAHHTLYLRLRLGLPLRVRLSEENSKYVSLPNLIRVAVGIVKSSEVQSSEVWGALHAQRVAETESIRVERKPNTELDCKKGTHTITRRDPSKPLRPSDWAVDF